MLVAQGKLDEALKAYRDGLATADRSNTQWQRDLSISYEKVGDVLRVQGKLDAALKAYSDDLAIMERLAAADRSNTLWQRDLSVSYNKVGNVLVAQGKLDEALKAYRGSLAVRERLAAANPSNKQWERDLCASPRTPVAGRRRSNVTAAPPSPGRRRCAEIQPGPCTAGRARWLSKNCGLTLSSSAQVSRASSSPPRWP